MELLFLVNSDHPGPDRSPIKEKELLQSEIKSHAARISHRKRRFLPTYRPTQSQTTAVQVRPNIAAAKSNLEDEKGKKEGDRITILRVPQKGRRKKLIWQPRPATISKGLPGIPISETRDTCTCCCPLSRVPKLNLESWNLTSDSNRCNVCQTRLQGHLRRLQRAEHPERRSVLLLESQTFLPRCCQRHAIPARTIPRSKVHRARVYLCQQVHGRSGQRSAHQLGGTAASQRY